MRHQATDEEIQILRDQLKLYTLNKNETILCDVSLRLHSLPNSYIPKELQKCKNIWLRTEYGRIWKICTQAHVKYYIVMTNILT